MMNPGPMTRKLMDNAGGVATPHNGSGLSSCAMYYDFFVLHDLTVYMFSC